MGIPCRCRVFCMSFLGGPGSTYLHMIFFHDPHVCSYNSPRAPILGQNLIFTPGLQANVFHIKKSPRHQDSSRFPRLGSKPPPVSSDKPTSCSCTTRCQTPISILEYLILRRVQLFKIKQLWLLDFVRGGLLSYLPA